MLQEQDHPIAHAILESVLVPKRAAKQRFRSSILEAWEHRCAYCSTCDAHTLDHVVPRRQGGRTVRANLVAACRRCNMHKGSEHWKVWFSRQEHYCPQREQLIEQWLKGQEWLREQFASVATVNAA